MGRFMGTLIRWLKEVWLGMVEPPWLHSGPEDERAAHRLLWVVGWSWTLAGMVAGALVSPSLVQWAGQSYPQYQDVLVRHQDWLTIGVAVLTGVLVQLIGWLLVSLGISPLVRSTDKTVRKAEGISLAVILALMLLYIAFFLVWTLPVAGVGYGIYRYLTWVGAGQRSVTIAFVGALLIKTFLIPFIKGIVTGALFKWFMTWLRGGKASKE